MGYGTEDNNGETGVVNDSGPQKVPQEVGTKAILPVYSDQI